MNKMKMLFASAALMALSATTASAVVIDFSYQTVEPPVSSIDMNVSGYHIVATGKGTDAAGNIVNDAKVNQTGSPLTGPNVGGLGVTSADDTNQSIDGGISNDFPNNVKDLLLLTFDSAVEIVGMSFSLVENDAFGPDQAYFTVDGVNMGTFNIDAFGWPAFMATSFKGTTFGIGALGQNSEFKLRAIEVTPVPVPPAALLLATGVAGIGALARRKAKKA